MTTGNAPPVQPPPTAPTRERFIATTLGLIEAEGGSQSVNLREVARRMGCAHTNVYNYFDSFGELLWEAFRRGLAVYGERLTRDVDTTLPAEEYLRRVIANLAAFPQEQPGLYRFIASDPIDLAVIPPDILDTVTAMKRWLGATCLAAAGGDADAGAAREAADIMLAYIDGETLNLINGRVVPEEDPAARVEANAMRLFRLLTGPVGPERRRPPDPGSILGSA
jgi:AcrR family transcriptional regulator